MVEIEGIYDGGRVDGRSADVLVRVSRKDIAKLQIGDRVAIRVVPRTIKKRRK
jgi:hypothetical protein